ncbi:hypothetical protein ACFWPU_44985 [Streptomyces sp. NPDC058471]|uniref:hypothetical protein n=1 Tax=Streptomyces sp. NPDC058471 TaxID=3346516 RepID=UPI003660BF67
MSNEKKRNGPRLSANWTARGAVLSVLGVITLGVAALSVAVSFDILDPIFGVWAVPTVAALDALWVVLQATEILAANNLTRAKRVQWAGLGLTAVIAGIPTADLILNRTGDSFSLAMVLVPVAIVATKGAWLLVLPALGRRVSPTTRQKLADRRQEVADRLEQMEADAAHRIELLTVATQLEQKVGAAQTAYRVATLKGQETTTNELHTQATKTETTITEKPLPSLVASIELPELDTWEPTAPALPVTPAALDVPQVSELDRDAEAEAARHDQLLVTVEEIAAVTGVPTPVPGELLDNKQIGVVLRALRYSEDPPMSGRQARAAYRAAGFRGAEHKIRPIWNELADESEESEEADESEESDRRN